MKLHIFVIFVIMLEEKAIPPVNRIASTFPEAAAGA